MKTVIENVLKELNIEKWSIVSKEVSTCELFFVKRSLDMRRIKKSSKYTVNVFRDFEKNGKKFMGNSTVEIVPSLSKEEITELIKKAYFASQFVANPSYELAEKQTCDHMVIDSDLSKITCEDAALKMAEALFKAESDSGMKSIINSSEFFAQKTDTRISTFVGTDVSFTKYFIDGEFVVQCKEPEDVEMHNTFGYDRLDVDSLYKKAASALSVVSDRAVAKKELPSGTYDVILSDEQLAEVLSYYVARTSAAMVYPHYSDWKVGDSVQGKDNKGETLSITGWAKAPYSSEGVPMKDVPLIENGKVKAIHGGVRYSSYMGIKPTGNFENFKCNNGSVDFKEMKAHPYLYPVFFSDFQMDEMSGHFGGEIRLAYYFDGERTRIITGGSVNGSINECCTDLVFSKERYESASYSGPFAVRLKNVKVAGTV